MNQLSKKMLTYIVNFAVPLTRIHDSSDEEAASGCCGADSVPDAEDRMNTAKKTGKEAACPEKRNHRDQEGIDCEARAWEPRLGACT